MIPSRRYSNYILGVLLGFVQNALQLAVARVAVGIGETAGTAPSHSLTSDYFEAERRGGGRRRGERDAWPVVAPGSRPVTLEEEVFTHYGRPDPKRRSPTLPLEEAKDLFEVGMMEL